LSYGNRTSISSESSSKPKNVNFVVGKTVYSCLIGMPSFSVKIKKRVRSDGLVHVSITRGEMKKNHPGHEHNLDYLTYFLLSSELRC
jgi:hypothetical protein